MSMYVNVVMLVPNVGLTAACITMHVPSTKIDAPTALQKHQSRVRVSTVHECGAIVLKFILY